MPEIVATTALFTAFAANGGVLMLYFVHMLQLNSYRSERYARWLRERRNITINQMGWLLLSAVAVAAFALQPGGWRVRAACALLFLIHFYLNFPKKAKKPLVFTNRVKRLLVTYAVLTAALGAVVYFTGMARFGLSLLFLWAAATPFVVSLCNAINRPIEKAIAARYIKDARRILDAMPRLTVIGITGSYGKTSVKNFLHALLSVRYNTLMTPESYNTTMGVVRTIREQLRPSHQFFIAEMGAKNIGDIQEICELVRPRFGVITAIGEQHLETFQTVDHVIRTKFELAESLPPDGAAFLNADNSYIRAHAGDVAVRVISYSAEGRSAQYTASDMTVGREGSSFTVTVPDGESRRFITRLLGTHNIQNLIGCIAVAHTLGISLAEMAVPIRRLKPVAHRLQLLPNGFIDDSYNSNPAGFRAALDVLQSFEGQRVLVTPGMVELGERQDALNRELGFYAAARCDYAVLVGKKQAPPLREGLLEGGFPFERLHVVSTFQDALAFLKTLPQEGERIVLLENDLPDNF